MRHEATLGASAALLEISNCFKYLSYALLEISNDGLMRGSEGM